MDVTQFGYLTRTEAIQDYGSDGFRVLSNYASIIHVDLNSN